MNRRNVLSYLILLLTILVLIMPSSAENNPISKEKAVCLAQSFVKDNGYTIAKPDKAKFKKESMERSSNVDEILKIRHNSLKARAIEAKKYGSGWMVIFEYQKPLSKNKNVGRAVLMDQYGQSLKMAHQDAKLKAEKNN